MLEVTVKHQISEAQFASWLAANATKLDQNATLGELLLRFARSLGAPAQAVKAAEVANSHNPVPRLNICPKCGASVSKHNLPRHLRESCKGHPAAPKALSAQALNC